MCAKTALAVGAPGGSRNHAKVLYGATQGKLRYEPISHAFAGQTLAAIQLAFFWPFCSGEIWFLITQPPGMKDERSRVQIGHTG
jgi:hypothetical protein